MKPVKKNITKEVENDSTSEVSTNTLTSEDLRSLNIVFDYAKRYTLDNDDNLLELLILKRNLFKKLKC